MLLEVRLRCRKKKYEEMARLAPQDQHKMIESLLKKRIEKGALKAEDYEQTYRNLQETLRFENVQSSGTTYQEAVNNTNIETAKESAAQIKRKAALTDIHESSKRAGLMAAGISGTVTAGQSLYELYQGEIELAEAISNTAIGAAKGYATGYAVTAASKGVGHVAVKYLGQSAGSAFVKSNAPTAMAAGIVTASKSMVAYMKGDISVEELQSEISHIAITCTSSFYYGALGQVVCPIPVLGAMVGAGVGYFVGNLLHQSSLIALGDPAIVKAARERRIQAEAFAQAAIPKIQAHRAELERVIAHHFAERKQEFTECFQILDSSLVGWEPDHFVGALERINNQFGRTLQFKNFDEFNTFMLDDKAALDF